MRQQMSQPTGHLVAVALGLAGALAAQDLPFARVESPLPAVLPAPLELARGLSLELVDGAVIAIADGKRTRLPGTAPTGAARAITVHPEGTVFVACERGLYVLDRDHLVLDHADLRDGIPPGEPIAVHADTAGRVWLCTAQAFGVVDARFGFARTFGATDGVPPPPYRGLRGDAAGRLLLTTATGTFAYQPDQGPPPFAAGGVVRARLDAQPDGSAAFELAVEALGGATLRQRTRHQHLLRPIEGTMLRGLRPGRHQVAVHAVDRDLRRAVVAEYDVHVPLPDVFDVRLLPLIAAAVGLVMLLLAWCYGGREQTGGAHRIWRAFGRTALLGAIALQLLAAFLGYGRSWPFVGFTMYTENWHRQDVLHRPHIAAIRADGSRLPRPIDKAGILQDDYWQMLSEVLFGDEQDWQRVLHQINRMRPRGEPEFTGFVLSDGRIRLTRDGPVEAAPTVLVRYEKP